MTIRSGTEYAVVIGDVVGSRAVSSQLGLLSDLQQALQWVGQQVEAVEPMTLTVGDEFQGVFADVRNAIRSTTLLRLHLRGRYDVRFGIGWGEVETVEPKRAPMAQSGAGWWRAREAIDEAAKLVEKRGWPRSVRIRVRGLDKAAEGMLLAFFLCQDHLLDAMDDKDARIAIGLFQGERQASLADRLDIPQSSISRRQLENGPSTIYRAHQELERFLG